MNKAEILEITERLKAIRLAHNQTASEFGDNIGMSKSSVYYYERGDRVPDALTLKAVHLKYFADINWVLTGNGSMSQNLLNQTLTPQESILLSYFKGLSSDTQDNLIKLLASIRGDKVI